MEENSFLTKTGMELVMHGGDARELIRKAMKVVISGDAAGARELLSQANEHLVEGHRAQTKVLQMECEGDPQGYNVLFCHGMDTLMTVKSEYEIAGMLVDMCEVFYGK